MGDMARTAVHGTYSLVYLVFNTIFNLLTQDDQVRCFENAARHLAGDGVFVVEAAVPRAWTEQYDYVNPEHVGKDSVVFDVCRYDPRNAAARGEPRRAVERRHQVRSPRLPPDLAERDGSHGAPRRPAAGRTLGGWEREPFTARSTRHVSVYELGPSREG